MIKNISILILIFSLTLKSHAQTYPVFGNEIPVTINGLSFDAMEPFISADGNFLFFNSLNDVINTSLYYASKVNDSTFNYAGPLTGANQTTSSHLDAVASLDSANDFYWVSTRDYPNSLDNYHHGKFNGTNVTGIGRVHGTFNLGIPGWLIMDAGINYDGSQLYYCNAYFNNCSFGLPCKARLGIAQKLNDSTFNKLSNTDGLMQNINDTNYLVYAPSVTKDGLELYYTRILRSNPAQTEMCVSVRNSVTDTFSVHSLIYASAMTPEASTLTTDKSKMYYHKKSGTLYKIFLRYRMSSTSTGEMHGFTDAGIFPNPFSSMTIIKAGHYLHDADLRIYNCEGILVKHPQGVSGYSVSVLREDLPGGVYFINLTENNERVLTGKMVVVD